VNRPLVRIITPAYNTSEFLSQRVSSALAQTYRNFELLIVDDGSTDDTASSVSRTSVTAPPES
jgi:glycosyltransferase involved in cell wall biosynthesis